MPMHVGAWPLRFAQPRLLLSCTPRRLLAGRAYQGPGGQQGVERRQEQHRTEQVHESLKYIRREQGPKSPQSGTGRGSSTQQQEGGPRDRSAPRTSRDPQFWQGQRSGGTHRQDQQQSGQQRRAPPDSIQRQPWQQQEPWAQRSSKGHERPPSSRQAYADRYDDRPRAPSIILQGEAVYGISTITAAMAANRRDLHTLYVQAGLDTLKRKDGGALARAISAASRADIPISTVSKHELNELVDNRPHQGLVLDCSPLPWVPLDTFPAPEARSRTLRLPVWLALDEVTDPQNLGSLVRSAYFLGAAGVLCCARNSAPLSPAVAKASSGALEMLPLHSCTNLMRTLQTASDAGWLVLGADAAPEAAPLSSFAIDKPTVLVMGSEGRGLRTLVRRCCHSLLKVDTPIDADVPGLDSLNVGVAGGIIMHRLLLNQRLG